MRIKTISIKHNWSPYSRSKNFKLKIIRFSLFSDLARRQLIFTLYSTINLKKKDPYFSFCTCVLDERTHHLPYTLYAYTGTI